MFLPTCGFSSLGEEAAGGFVDSWEVSGAVQASREDGKVEIAVGREDQAVGNHGIELFAEDGRIAVEGGSELGERLGVVGGVEGEEGGPAFVRKWEIAGKRIGEGPGAGVRIEGEGERLFKEHGIDYAQSGTFVAIVGGLLVEK